MGYNNGKHATAKEFCNKSKRLCEDALEILKKFCNMTAVFVFGLVGTLVLKLVGTFAQISFLCLA